MKKIFFLISGIILIFTSCDKVSNPYPPTNANAGDVTSCDTPSFPIISTHIRRVLVEDYTGHTCGNCPKAAEELTYCDSVYSGQIVSLAIHVGYFAEPCPPPPSTLPCRDYRTTVGDQYNTVFYASAGGLPQGVVNRKVFDSSNGTFQYLVGYQSHGWTNFVSTFIGNPAVAELQIINSYNPTTRKLCTALKSEFLTNLNGQYKLVVLLTQDSIIDWQIDYRYSPSMIPNYIHKHMLRDAINSTWGDEIANGIVTTGTTALNRYAYNIPTSYLGVNAEPEHMHVIAFIYDVATNEVLQAAEAKVIE